MKQKIIGEYRWIDIELPRVKIFFAKISKSLDSFCHKHGMKIDKYDHNSPSWDFCFRHPSEGFCQLTVTKFEDDSFVMITASWRIDDYDLNIRYLQSSDNVKAKTNNGEIEIALERALDCVLSMNKDNMTSYPGRPNDRLTKEQLEKVLKNELKDYPVLKNINSR